MDPLPPATSNPRPVDRSFGRRRSAAATTLNLLQLIGGEPGVSSSGLQALSVSVPRSSVKANLVLFQDAGMVEAGPARRGSRGPCAARGYFLTTKGALAADLLCKAISLVGPDLHAATVLRILAWYDDFGNAECSIDAMRRGRAGRNLTTLLTWASATRYTMALKEAGLLAESHPGTRRYSITTTGREVLALLRSYAKLEREPSWVPTAGIRVDMRAGAAA